MKAFRIIIESRQAGSDEWHLDGRITVEGPAVDHVARIMGAAVAAGNEVLGDMTAEAKA